MIVAIVISSIAIEDFFVTISKFTMSEETQLEVFLSLRRREIGAKISKRTIKNEYLK